LPPPVKIAACIEFASYACDDVPSKWGGSQPPLAVS
jgi:hypothetical protein